MAPKSTRAMCNTATLRHLSGKKEAKSARDGADEPAWKPHRRRGTKGTVGKKEGVSYKQWLVQFNIACVQCSAGH